MSSGKVISAGASSETGQATLEYALVTLLTVVVLVGLFSAFRSVQSWGYARAAAKSAPYCPSDPSGWAKDVLMH